MRLSIRLAAPTLVAAAAALAPSAAAANPACGQTLTHSVKLTANMDCSGYDGTALIVGRGHITINLNGHTLIGSGGSSLRHGIDNSSGWSNVTIKNGTVKNFNEDIVDYYAMRPRILHVHTINDGSGDYIGVDVEESQSGLIRGVVTTGESKYAIYLEDNNRVDVSRTHASGATFGIYKIGRAHV